MGLLDGLSKNLKADDLLPALNELAGRLDALETQICNITEARIVALEEFMAAHKAGASNRQREVDRLTAENQRLRWALSHNRQP